MEVVLARAIRQVDIPLECHSSHTRYGDSDEWAESKKPCVAKMGRQGIDQEGGGKWKWQIQNSFKISPGIFEGQAHRPQKENKEERNKTDLEWKVWLWNSKMLNLVSKLDIPKQLETEERGSFVVGSIHTVSSPSATPPWVRRSSCGKKIRSMQMCQ